MANKIKIGQAIRWQTRGFGENQISHEGVVMDADDNGMHIVPVYSIELWIKCYDDNGAKGKDLNHVRLQECPPPFSGLFRCSDNGCYADAYIGEAMDLSYEKFTRFGGKILDNGIQVPDRDMQDILAHMNTIEVPQKEYVKSGREASEFDDIVAADKRNQEETIDWSFTK